MHAGGLSGSVMESEGMITVLLHFQVKMGAQKGKLIVGGVRSTCVVEQPTACVVCLSSVARGAVDGSALWSHLQSPLWLSRMTSLRCVSPRESASTGDRQSTDGNV